MVMGGSSKVLPISRTKAAPATSGQKFLLLVWKNYVLQKRHKWRTIFEILIPVLFSGLLMVMRGTIDLSDYPDPTRFEPFNINGNISDLGFSACKNQFNGNCLVAYAPKTEETTELMKKAMERLDLSADEILMGFDTAQELEDYMIAFQPSQFRSSAVMEKIAKSPASKLTSFFAKRMLKMVLARYNLSRSDDESVGKINCNALDFWNSSNISCELFSSLALSTEGTYRMGVVFESSLDCSEEIDISIRPPAVPGEREFALAARPTWRTNLLYPTFQLPGPRERDFEDVRFGSRPGYFRQGFLAFQHAIFESLLATQNPDAKEYNIELQRSTFPPYVDDVFLVALREWLPLVLMLSFIYPCVNIVKSIVHEKERRLKESMKMMGLPNWVHWMAWFTKCYFFLAISCVVMTALLTIPVKEVGSQVLAVIEFGNVFLVFLFFFVYTFSTICFCFMISGFASQANTASTWAGLLFFITYVPFFIVNPRYETLGLSGKVLVSLFSNCAMAFTGRLIGSFEGAGRGIQMDNIFDPVTPDDQLTYALLMLMLILDGILYLLIAWYVDAVHPGEYGVPQPWYFFLQRSYWCGEIHAPDTDIDYGSIGNGGVKADFEEEPRNLHPGVQIRNLTKVYKRGVAPAVNQLSLNLYEGQITVLLGHNGAGKTTTMSMLTGFYPPTRGTAYVNGFDIRTDIAAVRSSLGLCPQHDVLFDELTVAEHLIFFCKLKGVTGADVEEEVTRYIKAVGLEDKRDRQSQTLSGGMKRKLSVAIALCGGSKVVMLDEPTSGMDPSARRATWDLLQEERKGRTILLTTHFMDEADLLGDRIAIMAAGQVQCCGSSLFLKKKYGAGYHLVIVKTPECHVPDVTDFVLSYVPDGHLDQNIGAELSYILPETASKKFPEMFRGLENNTRSLGISSFGVSNTTMEEVFIRVGEQVDPELKQQMTEISDRMISQVEAAKYANGKGAPQVAAHGATEATDDLFALEKEIATVRNRGIHLFLQQSIAQLVKKSLHLIRNRLLLATQILMPILFVFIGFITIRTLPGLESSPPREMDLTQYGEKLVTALDIPENSKMLEDVYTQLANRFRELNARVADVPNDTTVDDYLLAKAEDDLYDFNSHYLVAAQFNLNDSYAEDPPTIRGIFNGRAYHTPPLILQEIHNAILRAETDNPKCKIRISNKPLPLSEREELQEVGEGSNAMGFQIGFQLAFGMSFLAAGFITFLIRERVSRAKHLQYVSGLRFWLYWSMTFVIDYMLYLLTCVGVFIVFQSFQEEGFIEVDMTGRLIVIFLLYGFAILPLVYTVSFFFNVPSSGYTASAMLMVFVGLASIIAVSILQIPALGKVEAADITEWVFLLFPNFSLGMSINYLSTNFLYNKYCPVLFGAINEAFVNASDMEPLLDIFFNALGAHPPFNNTVICDLFSCSAVESCGIGLPCCGGITNDCGAADCYRWSEDYFNWDRPGIGRNLLFFLVVGVFFWLMIVLTEINVFTKIVKWWKPESRALEDNDDITMAEAGAFGEEDSDVRAERERIRGASIADLVQHGDKLILRDLTKAYSDNFVAVNHLCLGVPSGECFGLLGVNGAGKTTTFKMITGDESITKGDVYLDGISVRSDVKQVQQRLGYCPQFDGLIDQLTTTETIVLFARLRGVPERFIKNLTGHLSGMLLLKDHMHKLVQELSGGNKRKLSTAVALVGSPPIVFLDEPTTGMDPVARRLLWDAISRVRGAGRSIVLTSHSMEECEALCTRLVIMVNGQFKCLGSIQHIKNKFGQGYTLIAKVKPSEPREESLRRPPSALDSRQSAKGRIKRTSSSEGGRRKSSQQIITYSMYSTNAQKFRRFVEANFPGSILKDFHQGLLHYHIPYSNLAWSQIFEIMENGKESCGVSDYSVGQTSLEQVFLNFARAQRSEEDLM